MKYNGKEQNVNYSVKPAASTCVVKYNEIYQRPVDKGSYNARIICDFISSHVEKSVILTIAYEVKKESLIKNQEKDSSVTKFKLIKIPFLPSSSKSNFKSITKNRKLLSKSNVLLITVNGYAQPSGNKVADLVLSRRRAQAVASQIGSLIPNVNIKIKSTGSKLNSQCAPKKNKCVILK